MCVIFIKYSDLVYEKETVTSDFTFDFAGFSYCFKI